MPLSGTIPEGATSVLSYFPSLKLRSWEALRSSDTFFLIDDRGDARPRRTSITILTTFRVIGSLDGRSVSSEEFVFPVEVCNGCMVQYPAGLLEERNGGLFSAQRPMTVEETTEEMCGQLIGVDGVSELYCLSRHGSQFVRSALCQPVMPLYRKGFILVPLVKIMIHFMLRMTMELLRGCQSQHSERVS